MWFRRILTIFSDISTQYKLTLVRRSGLQTPKEVVQRKFLRNAISLLPAKGGGTVKRSDRVEGIVPAIILMALQIDSCAIQSPRHDRYA